VLNGLRFTRWRCLLALFVLVLLFAGITLLTSGSRINEKTYEQIEVGMTEEQVQAILGCPPGNYSMHGTTWLGSGPRIYWLHPEGSSSQFEPDVVSKAWITDDLLIGVYFDRDGRVDRKWREDVSPGKREHPLPRLWRRLSSRF
jgi:SmpA / OmlA family